MFRTLLTPLSAHFGLSPNPTSPALSPIQPDELVPEDFARDVLIELMRNAVERLKAAEALGTRSEVLTEIHKIMLEDAQTKEVFREMDGFLVVISVLSTIQDSTGADPHSIAALEATRLAFVILSEALFQHRQNVQYFKFSVGYESLREAMGPLVSNPATVKHSLGFIVSLALHKFSMSALFDFETDASYSDLDNRIRDFEPAFGFIERPEAFLVLYNLIPLIPGDPASLRYCIFKLLERLLHHNHRNHCVLSGLGLVEPLFHQYCEWKDGIHITKQEKQLVQKLLRKLIDVGITTHEARLLLRQAVKEGDTLDADVLEILRAGMKVKWPEHFSLGSSAALMVPQDDMRGLPPSGFTFMIWLWVERFPTAQAHPIFTCRLRNRALFSLELRPDGFLECCSSSHRETHSLKAFLSKARWVHVAVVHHSHRASNPTLRIFIDGVLTDGLNWQFPRPDANSAKGLYLIGDNNSTLPFNWCVASAYLIGAPIKDVLPRYIHHLGPRYTALFRSVELAKFLTYEASTAMHIYIDSVTQQSVTKTDVTQLHQAIKGGVGISKSSIVFAISTANELWDGEMTSGGGIYCDGDVYVSDHSALDLAMWRIGGAAIALRLVQLANSSHEVSRAIGIMADGLRDSWQNSEDMERLRGYDLFAEMLRAKPHFINMTGFETIFEFLGMNFRSPDQSTIVNSVAYRAIALDFQLWAGTRSEIQRVHLEHFSILLQTSKYKRFNSKQRLAKMGVVRKLLFVLQTSLYQYDMLPLLIEALKVVAQSHFTTDDAIKPIVSYLAANLHEAVTEAVSPRSLISRIDYHNAQAKAERVLEMLISILQIPAAYSKFSSSLPVTRICLLLLGERPSPTTAAQVLNLIGISLNASMSFSRKFELVSGWSVLKTVLPHAWDVDVQKAAFDLLFGRTEDSNKPPVVSCPQILPSIFSSLKFALEDISMKLVQDSAIGFVETETTVEGLLEELIQIHSTVPTFRHVFKNQSTTQTFIDTYRTFVASVSMSNNLPPTAVRILEKLSHLGLSIALDTVVSGTQKQEIMEILQSAETALNPRSSQETAIDSAAIVGSKMRRRRIASVRLSVQLGESTVKRSMSRIQDWRKTVILTEKKRIRKTVLDIREYHRQIASLTDWIAALTIERSLWANDARERHWQLDETEGPYRVRKKLEPTREKVVMSKVDPYSYISGMQLPELDVQSVMQLEVPPWADTYEVSSTSTEENQLNEEIVDDKHRRVRHELEPGDVIEAAYTVARIAGIDSSPGILIVGRTHIYILDGLVQDDNGEVIDARDAPKRLFFVPGGVVELNGSQRSQRWSHDQVISYSDRTFLFRDVALEIYFKDSRSLLMSFLDKRQRQDMNDRLSSMIYRFTTEQFTPSPGFLTSPNSGFLTSPGSASLMSPLLSPMVGRLSGKLSATLSAKVLSGLRMDELSTAQRKWQAREVSNFTYLSILNQISGRTPSDATQYPVFPWILSDYSSQTLDLHAESSFRDLTRPMGALNAAREEAARSRYSNLESVGENPFHYGTHFSSSMIVCHFLIRIEPFSHMFKTLQGGDWDLPDRLFSDVKRAYESASQDVRGDVRELIPEFFSLPEFLENSSRIDFGVQQNTGERIDDVKLPPWAKDDPLLFVTLNREALESDYVSRHLPHWIDLIWGYKQRDPKALNVFHPLSYEGSIDLDSITDELEREATVGIIHNFGQTPRKIFHSPHPERMMHGNSSLPIGTLYGIAEDCLLLAQSTRTVKDLGPGRAVRELVFDHISQRIIAFGDGCVCVPSIPHEQIRWDVRSNTMGDLNVFVDQKIVQVIEGASCSCAAFADSNTLVTGSFDHTVRLWRLNRGHSRVNRDSPLTVEPTHIMRAHTAEVTCVAASRAWSMVVSGSKDGSAALWDLNRGTYVRSIWHGPGRDTEVHLVAINESTGYIATCSRRKLCLHTINGRPITSLDFASSIAPDSYPSITSVAFLEREYSKIGVLATGGPDGTITLHTWNADNTPKGEQAHWEFVTLRSMRVKDPNGEPQPRGFASCVTALRFVGECLYHGEDTGRVFSWDLPD